MCNLYCCWTNRSTGTLCVYFIPIKSYVGLLIWWGDLAIGVDDREGGPERAWGIGTISDTYGWALIRVSDGARV